MNEIKRIDIRMKNIEKQCKLFEKEKMSDSDKLRYMLYDIQPYSFYWRKGFKKALERAIKLLEEDDKKKAEQKKNEQLL